MSAYRVALRWVLTLLAVALVMLAVLLGGLRLAASQVDVLRDDLSQLLGSQLNVAASLQALVGDWQGFDPAFAFSELRLVSKRDDDTPLLEIQRAQLRLDTSASLRAGYPVFAGTRISQATLHLYQDRQGRWAWPRPAELPPELIPETEFEIEGLDHMVELLLRQQVRVENFRLALHGIDDDVTLVAPRLLMTGDSQRAHLEGQLFIEGEQSHSLEAVLEVLPGRTQRSDVDARLQVRADLGSLSRLGQLMTQPLPMRLAQWRGEAELWGHWRAGRLEEMRAGIAIPELVLNSTAGPQTLHDVGAEAQWLRGERDTWRAWINPLTVGREQGGDSPLPERLYAQGDNQGWRVQSAPFDIASLTAWIERWPLPEAASRGLEALQPAGQVNGLEVDWRQGRWQARAALHNVTVSPWQGAPGGGPLDAWVTASDGQGTVSFVGQPGVGLSLPTVFSDPLMLEHASGEVAWSLVDNAMKVSGEDMRLEWHGAEVGGGFSWTAATKQALGEFALDLDMRDVNALAMPLTAWLPDQALGPELHAWLAGGVAGRVPRGSLSLRQPLGGDGHARDGELRLDLRIEEGRLPWDPQWPALENVRGDLTWHNERLRVTVEHAETLGLVSEGADVVMEDDRLNVQAPVWGETQALLNFLAQSPIEGMATFADWQSNGEIAGQITLNMPLADPEALELDVQASVDAPSLDYPQVDLALGNVNGNLRYRHLQNKDMLTGTLGARAFEGPLLARFDVGGEGIVLEGRALARGLLDWAGLGALDKLMIGYFPYSAQLDLEGEAPRLSLESNLQGLAIRLPAPFGKGADDRVPLHVDAIPGQNLNLELAERMHLRWRVFDSASSQGQVWLERWPSAPEWPVGSGWELAWQTPRLPLERWQAALAGLPLNGSGASASKEGAASSLRQVSLDTACLEWEQRCLGSLEATARPLPAGWQFDLAGSLAEGQVDYRPDAARPLNIALSRLQLDTLLADTTPQQPPDLASEIATAPEPVPLPGALNQLPDGQLRIDSLLRQGRRLGPLSARWEVSPQRLSIAPLTLTLGEISAEGDLIWESSGPQASLTRSRLELTGGDLGSMFEVLDQPVALRTEEARVQTQLAWPGAPWQFAFERSRGSIQAALNDGRFLTLDSPSARLVGLLNVDNLLRRLRLDFSDVTSRGTAFDSVRGEATLYAGRLETRGPIEIDGTTTQFTLDGSVNLAARQLDLLLGVTVPVSQNLPLAAVLAGAPYVGGALFLADRMFGGWIDKVTRIHYRVRGSWASPQITLENAE